MLREKVVYDPREHGPEWEEMLDKWVMAKRLQNFVLADKIKADLTAEGINPDLARPCKKHIEERGYVIDADGRVLQPRKQLSAHQLLEKVRKEEAERRAQSLGATTLWVDSARSAGHRR